MADTQKQLEFYENEIRRLEHAIVQQKISYE
jgi:hypothetical protein